MSAGQRARIEEAFTRGIMLAGVIVSGSEVKPAAPDSDHQRGIRLALRLRIDNRRRPIS